MSDIVIKYEPTFTSKNYVPETIATFTKVDYDGGSDDFLIFQSDKKDDFYKIGNFISFSNLKKTAYMQIWEGENLIKKDLTSFKAIYQALNLYLDIRSLIKLNFYCQDNVFNLYNLIFNKLSNNNNNKKKYNVESKIKTNSGGSSINSIYEKIITENNNKGIEFSKLKNESYFFIGYDKTYFFFIKAEFDPKDDSIVKFPYIVKITKNIYDYMRKKINNYLIPNFLNQYIYNQYINNENIISKLMMSNIKYE